MSKTGHKLNKRGESVFSELYSRYNFIGFPIRYKPYNRAGLGGFWKATMIQTMSIPEQYLVSSRIGGLLLPSALVFANSP